MRLVLILVVLASAVLGTFGQIYPANCTGPTCTEGCCKAPEDCFVAHGLGPMCCSNKNLCPTGRGDICCEAHETCGQGRCVPRSPLPPVPELRYSCVGCEIVDRYDLGNDLYIRADGARYSFREHIYFFGNKTTWFGHHSGNPPPPQPKCTAGPAIDQEVHATDLIRLDEFAPNSFTWLESPNWEGGDKGPACALYQNVHKSCAGGGCLWVPPNDLYNHTCTLAKPVTEADAFCAVTDLCFSSKPVSMPPVFNWTELVGISLNGYEEGTGKLLIPMEGVFPGTVHEWAICPV